MERDSTLRPPTAWGGRARVERAGYRGGVAFRVAFAAINAAGRPAGVECATIETSAKVLITAGVLTLAYGFLLGFAMARARMAGPSAPKQLVNVHLEALIQGAALLGLSVAASFSTLASGWEETAAWLLAAGAALTLAGGTVNWLEHVEDAFKARSRGFLLQATGGPVNTVGILILVIGVLKAL